MAVNYLSIVLNFILGGISVAGTSVVGNFMNPLAGALFWSYPITIIPSLFFMKDSGKSSEYLAKFLVSTTFSLILLGITTFAMSYFIGQDKKLTNFVMDIGKGTLVYFVSASLFYLIIKILGLSHYFM